MDDRGSGNSLGVGAVLARLFIILVLLLANAAVGFWEEYQAGNVIAALKAKLALQPQVKRDGQWTSVPARDLVPGDLIRLRLGDIIPAEAKLLDGDPVEVDQSALTRESLPVTHQTGETVTWTQNKLTLGEPFCIDFAVLSGVKDKKQLKAIRVTHFQPFDPCTSAPKPA